MPCDAPVPHSHTRRARLMSSDGPSSRVGALNVPGGNLVPVHDRRSILLCAKARSLSTCLRGQASHRDGIGSSPLRIEAGVSLLSDNDLLEGCPRRGHARRHRCLTRWRIHPCSSIGWTNPPSELDLRGARHEPSRPHVQRCASRVWLSTSLLDARCISTTSADGAREWCSGAALDGHVDPTRSLNPTVATGWSAPDFSGHRFGLSGVQTGSGKSKKDSDGVDEALWRRARSCSSGRVRTRRWRSSCGS